MDGTAARWHLEIALRRPGVCRVDGSGHGLCVCRGVSGCAQVGAYLVRLVGLGVRRAVVVPYGRHEEAAAVRLVF